MTHELTTGDAVPRITRGWRMKMALAYAGVSVQQMADYLEVDRGTITRYTSDKAAVKRSTLLAWSFRTGVSLQWIETGQTHHAGAVGGRPRRALARVKS